MNRLKGYLGKNGKIQSEIPFSKIDSTYRDSIKWMDFHRYFKPNGEENFFVFGNIDKADSFKVFIPKKVNARFAYYFVDDIELIELNKNVIDRLTSKDSLIFLNEKLPLLFGSKEFLMGADTFLNKIDVIVNELSESMKINPLMEVNINVPDEEYKNAESNILSLFEKKRISLNRIYIQKNLNSKVQIVLRSIFNYEEYLGSQRVRPYSGIEGF